MSHSSHVQLPQFPGEHSNEWTPTTLSTVTFQDPSFKNIYGVTGPVKEPPPAINPSHISNLSFRWWHHYLGPNVIQI